ncbi:MAG: PGPGW domain-containing protein [Planctomycetales bacterium]|nr:PGPGW domain-containing protein [Planctomycetales bacterium]
MNALKRFAAMTIRQARRVVVLVVGLTVVAIGIAMLVLPGPAVVVIPLGLGVLALEFTWAKRWLGHLRNLAKRQVVSLEKSRGGRPASQPIEAAPADEPRGTSSDRQAGT